MNLGLMFSCFSTCFFVLFSFNLRYNSHTISQSVSSVTQSCPTLCNPMNHSTPGLSVHHQLPEFTQTHVHRVGDTIKPSHPHSNPKERQCQRMLKLPHNCTHLSSVQFSCSVVSNSMQSHELQWPCLPVHHQLPEFTKTHIHQV